MIKQAKEHSELIIMDECGSFEKDSIKFQKEILNALDGEVTILGIIKLKSIGWIDNIRNHPRVKLITVTEENRNKLPGNIINYFK